MGTEYSQLDLNERIEVFRLHLEGRSYRQIGRLGRHHTTIIRVVKRNSPAPLAVSRFAVTFDEWDACAADGGSGILWLISTRIVNQILTKVNKRK